MQINTDKFIRFLDLLVLTGCIQNTEVLAHGDSKGLTAMTVLPNTAMALKGRLGGSFDELGTIGLDDTILLKKFVNMFNGCKEIDVKINRNKLTITAPDSDTKASAVLREPSLIKNSVPNDKFEAKVQTVKGNEFTLTPEIMVDIVKHFEAIGTKKLLLTGEGNKINLSLENNQNELLVSFPIKESVEKFTITLNRNMIDLLSVLNVDVTASVLSDDSIFIELVEEDLVFEYFVAANKLV